MRINIIYILSYSYNFNWIRRIHTSYISILALIFKINIFILYHNAILLLAHKLAVHMHKRYMYSYSLNGIRKYD